jgi:hypothetical protein
MFAIEYPKNGTLVFSYANGNKFFVNFLRNKKTILLLEVDNFPRLSMSDDGLLAIAAKKTIFYDLNDPSVPKPKSEISGIWHLSPAGELFTIASQNNPVKNPENGNLLTGLIAQDLKSGKVSVINDQLKSNPTGLYIADDGKTWVLADIKNNQYLFGKGNLTTGKFSWNKGQLGDMSYIIHFDIANQGFFVKHDFYKFSMISFIGFDQKIKSLKSEKKLYSFPVLVNNQWLLLVETEKKLTSGLMYQHLVNLYHFDADKMLLGEKVNDQAVGQYDVLLKPLANGQLAILGNKQPLYLDMGLSSGKPAPDEGSDMKPVIKKLLSLTSKFETLFDTSSLFGSFLNYAESKEQELNYAQLSDSLNFGLLPIFQLSEHRFIGLVPDPELEFAEWPIVEYDEGWGYLENIFDTKDKDLSLFMEKPTIKNQEQARLLFSSCWATDTAPVIEAAKVTIQQTDMSNSPVYHFVETIAISTKNTLHTQLLNAGDSLEKTGNYKAALCFYYNTLVGSELDDLNEDALNGLLRCSQQSGSESFKVYCGLILKRIK